MPSDKSQQPGDGSRPAVVATREKSANPGTPSRRDRIRESSAVQDPGLKDYVCCTDDNLLTLGASCNNDSELTNLSSSGWENAWAKEPLAPSTKRSIGTRVRLWLSSK